MTPLADRPGGGAGDAARTSWAEPIEGGVLVCWSCGHRMPGFPDWLPRSVACVSCHRCGATIWIWRADPVAPAADDPR